MSSCEHRFQPRELHALVDKTGDFSDSSTRPEESADQLKELVVDDLKTIYTEPGAAVEFENKLTKAGLVPMLEEVGILPSKDPPSNPYDSESEGSQYKQWYEEHTEEYKNYRRRLEVRDITLRHLYAGVVLNRNYDSELFPRKKVGKFGFVTLGTPSSNDM